MVNNFILLLSLALVVTACGDEKKIITNEQEYVAWLNEKDHGCISEKTVKNVQFSAKYLPTQFLTLREMQMNNYDSIRTDSVRNEYARGISFFFIIKPVNESKDVDIMFADVYNVEGFRERVHDMNFLMADMFSLQYDDKEISPSLFHLENDYGLSNGRGMMMVFPNLDSTEIKNMKLVFDDQLFNTGINKFAFNIDYSLIPEYR